MKRERADRPEKRPLHGGPPRSDGPSVLEIVVLTHQVFHQRLIKMGVTVLQAGVLAYLSRHRGAHIMDTAAALRVRPRALIPVLDDLQRQRLLIRRRLPPDNRARLLVMTERGWAKLARIEARTADITL